ncbi:MAG: CHAT domain-containing protein [Gammaproteobacteria bacterium]|nr:CHAT domain-containing protein [Gammaproteobacteria bacterium]
MMKSKILFITANPVNTGRVRLREEEQKIREALKNEQWEFASLPVARAGNLRAELRRTSPRLVHFSGHGEGEAGLVIQDELDHAQTLSTRAVADFFRLYSSSVECMVLNACHSAAQAEEIARHIDYVIGMTNDISDQAALAFSQGFYTAFCGNGNYFDCFRHACNQIDVAACKDEIEIPHFYKREVPVFSVKKLLLGKLNIADNILKKYYMEARPEFCRQSLPKNFDLNCILDELSLLIKPDQEQAVQPALLKFTGKLAQHISDDATRQELSDWEKQTRVRLGLFEEEASIPAAELHARNDAGNAQTETCFLSIGFIEAGDNACQVQAVLHHRQGNFETVFGGDETYAVDALQNAVSDCLDALDEQFPDVFDAELIIELALPYKLLNEDVDRWQYFYAPLSQDWPIVVRSKDRIDRGPLRGAWKNLWDKARDSGALAKISDASEWLAQERTNDIPELLNKKKKACLKLEFFPEITKNRSKDALFKLIRHGASISLWPRRCAGLEILKERAQRLLSRGGYELLPEQFRQLCCDRTGNDKECDITLFWDIPERIPTFNKKFKAPQ